MGFLKKIRNNILNQQNSFHVGFGNRSPFSYRGKYSGDWTPEVPNLAAGAYGQPETDLGEMDLLKAQIDTIGKVETAVTDVAKAYIKKEAKEKCTGIWDEKNEKCVNIK
jgi:hypothetical protein